MKVIKLGIISVIVLFLIITVFSLMIPSNIRISRAANLGSDKTALLSLLKDTTQWPRWNPAFMPDPNRQHIKTRFLIITDTLILSEWQQGNKQTVLNGWQIHSISQADSLTLQWYMDFKLQWYPWKKFESLFFDKVYGSMMEKGLFHIKNDLSRK